MKFIAVSHNVTDPTPLVRAEAARTAQLAESGVIERVWLKADRSGAVLLLNAADTQTAQAAIDSLPLVANGIARFDITHVVEPPTA